MKFLGYICANSPQAKGRVERANGTLQDRLVKEMRLQNISSIEKANKFLPKFMDDYNRRFAVEPSNTIDAHRDFIPDDATLELIFSQQHERIISKNLEISYKNFIYQIQSETPSYNMRKSKLIVSDRNNEIKLIYKGKILNYKVFDKSNRPTKVVNSKSLNNHIKKAVTKPKVSYPWRNYSISKSQRCHSNKNNTSMCVHA